MRVVGIDPGRTPGVALITNAGADVRLLPAVVKQKRKASPGGCDENALRATLLELAPEVVYLERVNGMPGQSGPAAFVFGSSWGLIRGICVGLGIRYVLVTPQVWKRTILKDYDLGQTGDSQAVRKAKNKNAAIAWVRARYPSVNLFPSKRSRNENDNMAEALCVGHYGRLMERQLRKDARGQETAA